jgi:hypothetical protein
VAPASTFTSGLEVIMFDSHIHGKPFCHRSLRHALARRSHVGRYAAEALEPRRLLATLVVNGGSGDDHISLKVDANFIYAPVNGFIIPQPVGAWDAIQINGQGGNDDILIKNTGSAPVDIFPGAGADHISICSYLTFDPDDPPVQDLDVLSARVYVHSGSDATDDTLEISDAFDAISDPDDTYDLDQNPGPMRLVKPDAPGNQSEEVWWDEANLNVTLFTSADDSTINVGSDVTLAATDETLTVIETGNGNDTLTFNGSIGNGNRFDFQGVGGDDTLLLIGDSFSGSATISFSAGPGTNLLTVQDSAATDSYDFSLDPGGAELDLTDGTQTGVVLGRSVTSFGLSSTNATQGSNFNIESVETDLSISAGGGNDHLNFNVALASHDDRNFTFSGGTGTDTITLDGGQFGPGADFTHTFDNASYDNTASLGLLSWSSISSLTYNGSPGVDRFVVNTGLGLSSLTLNGNDNNDTFTVTPNSITDIFCNGGAPTSGLNERLTLVGGGATGGIFTPNGATGGAYTFANRDPVTFTGIEVFTTPGAAPSIADLAANDDAGPSSTDNITNQTILTFSGTGVLTSNPLEILRDGTPVASLTPSSTTWQTNVTFPTGDNTYQMVVRYETTATGLLSNPSPALAVRVDTVAPAAPGIPDLNSNSDTGLSSTDNVTRDNTPQFDGSVAPGDLVQLFSNGVHAGSDSTTATGSYSIVSTSIGDGSIVFTTKAEDLAGNLSVASSGLTVTIDTLAPTLTNSVFNFLTSQNVRFTFSENLGTGIALANISLRDMTHGVNTPNSSLAMVNVLNLTTVTFSGFAGFILTDADWRMTIDTNVTDIAGNPFAGTQFNFFFLNGDANRDRTVNLLDFNVLTSNFGQSGRNFSQGDFTYDGAVNLSDFNVLAARFGSSVGPEGALAPRTGTALLPPSRSGLSILEELL